MEQERMDIRSQTLEELTVLVEELGEKRFRAKQLYQWLHVHRAETFDEMTNLPKSLIGKLKAHTALTVLRQEAVQVSAIDGTRKYLFSLPDGNLIESVLMRYQHGNSVCISSQAGCRMGCRFCASAIGGLVRGLTPAEMAEQVYRIGRETGERISNIVVMGTGEPLDNYENLLRFLTMMTDENGLHISQRNITVSTCGIVPRIRQLAEEGIVVRAAKGRYKLKDSIMNYILTLKVAMEAAGTDSPDGELDLEEEKAIHERVKRHISELKLQVMKGELHSSGDVERVMTDMLVSIRARLLAMPTKLAPLLVARNDAGYIRTAINREVLDALNELKDYNPKDFHGDELVDDDSEDYESAD